MKTLEQIKKEIEVYQEAYSDSIKTPRVARLEQMIKELVEIMESNVNADTSRA